MQILCVFLLVCNITYLTTMWLDLGVGGGSLAMR
jgi:hypothetical protein